MTVHRYFWDRNCAEAHQSRAQLSSPQLRVSPVSNRPFSFLWLWHELSSSMHARSDSQHTITGASREIRDHEHHSPYVQPDQSCFCFSFHWIATWMERHNSFLTTRLGRLRALGPHMRCAPNGHSWRWTWNVRVVLFGRYWSLSAGTRCLLWTITKRMNTAVLPIWTSSNASAATSKLLIAKLNWINSKTCK